jgi:hypothetical protein
MNNRAKSVKAEIANTEVNYKCKNFSHRNAYLLKLNNLNNYSEYNISMSARHLNEMKMYAELKQKKCKFCNLEKNIEEFSTFNKKEKVYTRPFCFDCKSKANFEYDLWKNYRIRLSDYERLYEAQEGNCACCGQHEEKFKRKLHVDHDHESGKIRGLLCTQCNPGIGYFQDSIERLQKAINYLKKFKN